MPVPESRSSRAMLDESTRGSQAGGAGGPRRDRRPPGAVALLTGLLAAPLAWFAQINIIEALAAQSCFAHDRPLPQPWMHSALTAIDVVSAVCLAIGVCGTVVAWRNRRVAVTLAREAGAGAGAKGESVRRIAFIARVSLLSTLVFLAGLIATDIARLIVSPCSRW